MDSGRFHHRFISSIFFRSIQEAIRSKGHRYERSKNATIGAPGLTTRSKDATSIKKLTRGTSHWAQERRLEQESEEAAWTVGV